MQFIHGDIFIQPFAVLNRSEASTTSDSNVSSAPATSLSGSGASDTDTALISASLNRTFSSTPVIWQAELNAQYRDVGEALSHMASLDDSDDLMIEAPVYAAASFVAASLMSSRFPAPHVFTHGSKSVVFNWINGADNLYLTVSADKLSVLVTTPERIKTRLDLSAKEGFDPVKLLGLVPRQLEQQQKVLVLPSGTSEPPDFLR